MSCCQCLSRPRDASTTTEIDEGWSYRYVRDKYRIRCSNSFGRNCSIETGLFTSQEKANEAWQDIQRQLWRERDKTL